MHITAVSIPLLAFTIGITAASIPPHSVARAIPDVNEVARNPAPIDDRVNWDDHGKPTLGNISHLSPDDLKKLKEIIKHLLGGRAVAAESVVVHRSIPDFHDPTKKPVEIRP
ncbi:hypothetical protein G6011_10414 [Alternaria panax]|uniref:Uncharacterized protein n=1 Tax=Alternaria panax TaxID=48097 RepID=A0AAD4NRX1_9PLEO|nr:hypothetical protein G6011_10414 [Alternaria panax]